jgi:hypothetical protein
MIGAVRLVHVVAAVIMVMAMKQRPGGMAIRCLPARPCRASVHDRPDLLHVLSYQ